MWTRTFTKAAVLAIAAPLLLACKREREPPADAAPVVVTASAAVRSDQVTLTSGALTVEVPDDGKAHLVTDLIALPKGDDIRLRGKNEATGQSLEVRLSSHPKLGLLLTPVALVAVRGPSRRGFVRIKRPVQLRLENKIKAPVVKTDSLIVSFKGQQRTFSSNQLAALQDKRHQRGTDLMAIARAVTTAEVRKVIAYGARDSTMTLTGDRLSRAVLRTNKNGKLRVKIRDSDDVGLREVSRLEVF